MLHFVKHRKPQIYQTPLVRYHTLFSNLLQWAAHTDSSLWTIYAIVWSWFFPLTGCNIPVWMTALYPKVVTFLIFTIVVAHTYLLVVINIVVTLTKSGHLDQKWSPWPIMVTSGHPDQKWSPWPKVVTLTNNGHQWSPWPKVVTLTEWSPWPKVVTLTNNGHQWSPWPKVVTLTEWSPWPKVVTLTKSGHLPQWSPTQVVTPQVSYTQSGHNGHTMTIPSVVTGWPQLPAKYTSVTFTLWLVSDLSWRKITLCPSLSIYLPACPRSIVYIGP